MPTCPGCGNELKALGKAGEDYTANGHHAQKFECRTKGCPQNGDVVYGGF